MNAAVRLLRSNSVLRKALLAGGGGYELCGEGGLQESNIFVVHTAVQLLPNKSYVLRNYFMGIEGKTTVGHGTAPL